MASKALPALDDLTSSLKSVSLSSSPSSSSSSTGGVLLIDSLKKCSEAMGALIDRAEPVAVDFEGIALSREGRMCLAQVVSADDSEPVYLVDVVALGADAFGVGRLGELLSSETLVSSLRLSQRPRGAATPVRRGPEPGVRHTGGVLHALRRGRGTQGRAAAWPARGARRLSRAGLGSAAKTRGDEGRRREDVHRGGRRIERRLGEETVTARARELRRRGRPVPSRHVQGVEAFHEAGQDGQGRGQAQTERKRARL